MAKVILKTQTKAFAAAVLVFARQAKRRYRLLASVKSTREVATTIRLSSKVPAASRATGAGWQTRMDAALKIWQPRRLPV